jgi:osmotically-inducible protein OsmY
MRSDSEIKRDVEDELRWDPRLDDTDVAVSVRDGVVELAGFVKSFPEKIEAEEAASRVKGVSGIADDIEVRLPAIDDRPDPDIAREAVASLKDRLPLTANNIKVIVKHNWVTLEGEVEWHYLREASERAIRDIRGVKGVSNHVKLRPRQQAANLKKKVEDALLRLAEVDAQRISVEEEGGHVTLKGIVHSWAEREAAEHAAWSAPGITGVTNEIVIGA